MTNDNLSFANELNTFYSRFDTHDFTMERQNEIQSMPSNEFLEISEEQVINSFKKINIRKASGPDGLTGIVLKECRLQLAGIFRKLFQTSLETHVIPQLWKTSNVI